VFAIDPNPRGLFCNLANKNVEKGAILNNLVFLLLISYYMVITGEYNLFVKAIFFDK
jgi:hypothetical protein